MQDMKTLGKYTFPLLMVLLLAACVRPSKRQIASDTHRMITFVKSTFYENYGDSLALDTFWYHYKRYYAAYILRVNQKELLDINQLLYAEGGTLFGHYIDAKRWEPQEELMERGLRSIFAQFAPFRMLPLRTDTYGYLRSGLAKAKSPFLRQVFQNADTTHMVPYMEDMRLLLDPYCRENYPYIPNNIHLKPWMDTYDVPAAFRHGDEEVQQFVALYMWAYLSHCANVDVYSGQTREALLRQLIPVDKEG